MNKEKEIKPIKAWAAVDRKGLIPEVFTTRKRAEEAYEMWPDFKIVKVQIQVVK